MIINFFFHFIFVIILLILNILNKSSLRFLNRNILLNLFIIILIVTSIIKIKIKSRKSIKLIILINLYNASRYIIKSFIITFILLLHFNYKKFYQIIVFIYLIY